MGGDSKVRLIRRDTWHRFSRWAVSVLKDIQSVLETKESLLLSVECPHCLSGQELSDDIEFGRLYEFTCPECKNLFVVVIPDIIVRKGRLEADKHGN